MACSSASSNAPAPRPVVTPTASHATTIADVAMLMAQRDRQPAEKATYLTPLKVLHRDCRDGSPDAVGEAVGSLADRLRELDSLDAPAAEAEAALVAGVRHGADCAGLADSIGNEVGGPLDATGNRYLRIVRFSPDLTADVVLAAITHFLLPGKVHVVYALKAFSCQQAIFMGPAIGREYENPELGAFVQLTSRHGVGHGKYDAKRVNRARITPFGRRGGQPCS